jgi:hypothetical protein
VLFVDVCLGNDHPEFASGGRVDDLSTYYRRAKLIVSGMRQPVELPSGSHDPAWNEARKEYTPVGRIVDAKLENAGQRIVMEVSGMHIRDSFALETEARSIDLIFGEFKEQTPEG